jgi:hypothetical protein
MGRLGSISGSLLAGLFLNLHWQPHTIFLAASAAHVLGAATVLAIGFFDRRRPSAA